jgi:hypothetical protein
MLTNTQFLKLLSLSKGNYSIILVEMEGIRKLFSFYMKLNSGRCRKYVICGKYNFAPHSLLLLAVFSRWLEARIGGLWRVTL